MVNQQVLEGNWNEIKGKIRTRWGQLTDDDLPQFRGEIDKLVGTIQRKTGEGRDAIERYLNDLSGSSASSLSHAADEVRQYTQRAAESVQNSARQAADQFRAGYDEARRMLHERPAQSIAVCFGAGLLVGIVLGVVIKSR